MNGDPVTAWALVTVRADRVYRWLFDHMPFLLCLFEKRN
jgi:hypothetical protein